MAALVDAPLLKQMLQARTQLSPPPPARMEFVAFSLEQTPCLANLTVYPPN